MTPENFCYWLQGLFEVGNPTTLTDEQVAMIREHLQLVFTKKTERTAKPAAPGVVPLPYVPPVTPCDPLHQPWQVWC